MVIFRLILDKEHDEEITARVHARSPLTDRIEELVMRYSGDDRIRAYTEDDVKLIRFAEIECILVEDGRTFAIDARGERFRLKERLYEIEERLPAYFIRINKSAIANEKRIERFRATLTGAVDAVFKCGYREYVSRRCFAEIKRRFEL